MLIIWKNKNYTKKGFENYPSRNETRWLNVGIVGDISAPGIFSAEWNKSNRLLAIMVVNQFGRKKDSRNVKLDAFVRQARLSDGS